MVKTESQTNSNIYSCIRKLHSYGKSWGTIVAVPLAKYTKQRQKTPNQLSMSPMEQPAHGAEGYYGAGMVNAVAPT